MSQSGRFALAQEMDNPVSLHEIYLFCYKMLTKPTITEMGDLDPHFLERHNRYLDASISAIWRKGFGALLKHIGDQPTFSEQRSVVLNCQLSEIEWRARDAAFAESDVAWTPDLAELLLSTPERRRIDLSLSCEYILDTQKWMSWLTMSGLKAMSEDIFKIDSRTELLLEQYEVQQKSFTLKLIKAMGRSDPHGLVRAGEAQYDEDDDQRDALAANNGDAMALLEEFSSKLATMRMEIIAHSLAWWRMQVDLNRLDAALDRLTSPPASIGVRAVA